MATVSVNFTINRELSDAMEREYREELKKFNEVSASELAAGFYKLVSDPRLSESVDIMNEVHNQLFRLNNTKNNKMKNFKLEDFETGMRVKTRCGWILIVSRFSETSAIVNEEGLYLDIQSLDSSLKNNGIGGDKYDIMEIYAAPNAPGCAFNFNRKGELLWRRKEEIPELTMAEAIEKIGFEFKIKK